MLGIHAPRKKAGQCAQTIAGRNCLYVMGPGICASKGSWLNAIPMSLADAMLSFQRLIIEYPTAVNQAIAGVLSKEEIQRGYWYGIFICTNAMDRQKGLASSLVSYALDLARKDGRPVWIEAPSFKTAQLYQGLGFEHAGQVVVGKGAVGTDGLAKEGGEGITAWGMIYRPRQNGWNMAQNKLSRL